MAFDNPTIRVRLDRLFDRIRILEGHAPSDSIQARIRLLGADGEMSAKLAKELLQLYKDGVKGGRK